MAIRFTVFGEPTAKGRPRFRSFDIGDRSITQTYTPKTTENYENLVKMSWQLSGVGKVEGMLQAKIEAHFKIPKSTPKKKRQQMIDGEIRPEKKPDIDNIAKIILDSLNGRAYDDDKSIVELQVSKFYSENPRVEVIISEVA